MRGGGGMRGAKPPHVDPNAAAACAGAVLPTHVVPADRSGGAIARNHCPVGPAVVSMLLSLAIVAAILGFLMFGVWMNPVVSIDSVSATGLGLELDVGGRNASATISPSFNVAVRLKRRWFYLLSHTYANGTVAVSCAGGAVTARGGLRNVTLTAISASMVSATARAPPTALPGDARDRLGGELRRGEVHLDVSVSYDGSDPDAPLCHGLSSDFARSREFDGDGVVQRREEVDNVIVIW